MESSTIKSGGVGGAGHAKPWGDKEGSEQDKESLKRIIVAKLQTAGTAGDFCSKMKFLCLVYPGVDEALAEAIDSKFYDAYKKWKRVKVHESPEVKVVCFKRRTKFTRIFHLRQDNGWSSGATISWTAQHPRIWSM